MQNYDTNAMSESSTEFFPDGITPVDNWFYDSDFTNPPHKQKFYAKNFGAVDDGKIHTREIQGAIDFIASSGGGTLIFNGGTVLSGALFFKKDVSLCIEKDAVLKGSDDICDYPVCETRIEGQTCNYFPALINADQADGFAIFGGGTIDGNGLRSWKAFWLRREWNPECTNKDEQRARLIFISNSRDVTISGVRLQNSQFWTTHFYKCSRVKILSCQFFSPASPVPAPSTDAIDLDACKDVLIKNCSIEVNDDAVALKGGKGPYADTAAENGSNERIIIEDCTYGFCHGCLTLGSESIHNKNIIMRRIEAVSGYNLLWLKMRPDTPQLYEHILVEDITARVKNFITIKPWTQFFDLQGRKEIPRSKTQHLTVRRCNCTCETAYNIEENDSQYELSDFNFEDITIKEEKVQHNH